MGVALRRQHGAASRFAYLGLSPLSVDSRGSRGSRGSWRPRNLPLDHKYPTTGHWILAGVENPKPAGDWPPARGAPTLGEAGVALVARDHAGFSSGVGKRILQGVVHADDTRSPVRAGLVLVGTRGRWFGWFGSSGRHVCTTALLDLLKDPDDFPKFRSLIWFWRPAAFHQRDVAL